MKSQRRPKSNIDRDINQSSEMKWNTIKRVNFAMIKLPRNRLVFFHRFKFNWMEWCIEKRKSWCHIKFTINNTCQFEHISHMQAKLADFSVQYFGFNVQAIVPVYKSFLIAAHFFGNLREDYRKRNRQLNFPVNLTQRWSEHTHKWIYSSEIWFTNATYLAWFKFRACSSHIEQNRTHTHEYTIIKVLSLRLLVPWVINEFKIAAQNIRCDGRQLSNCFIFS